MKDTRINNVNNNNTHTHNDVGHHPMLQGRSEHGLVQVPTFTPLQKRLVETIKSQLDLRPNESKDRQGNYLSLTQCLGAYYLGMLESRDAEILSLDMMLVKELETNIFSRITNEASIEILKEYEKDEHPELLFLLGRDYLTAQKPNPEKGIEILEKIAPFHFEAAKELGRFYFVAARRIEMSKFVNYAKAVKYYKIALGLKKDSKDICHILAKSLLNGKVLEGAQIQPIDQRDYRGAISFFHQSGMPFHQDLSKFISDNHPPLHKKIFDFLQYHAWLAEDPKEDIFHIVTVEKNIVTISEYAHCLKTVIDYLWGVIYDDAKTLQTLNALIDYLDDPDHKKKLNDWTAMQLFIQKTSTGQKLRLLDLFPRDHKIWSGLLESLLQSKPDDASYVLKILERYQDHLFLEIIASFGNDFMNNSQFKEGFISRYQDFYEQLNDAYKEWEKEFNLKNDWKFQEAKESFKEFFQKMKNL